MQLPISGIWSFFPRRMRAFFWHQAACSTAQARSSLDGTDAPGASFQRGQQSWIVQLPCSLLEQFYKHLTRFLSVSLRRLRPLSCRDISFIENLFVPLFIYLFIYFLYLLNYLFPLFSHLFVHLPKSTPFT